MSNTTSRSAPVSQKERVTSLDLIRGIAILGILPMNALTWGFSDFAGYSNVRAVGTEQPFDWVIGIASKLFIEQKMMALFSLLFGVGVVIFWERARRHPIGSTVFLAGNRRCCNYCRIPLRRIGLSVDHLDLRLFSGAFWTVA